MLTLWLFELPWLAGRRRRMSDAVRIDLTKHLVKRLASSVYEAGGVLSTIFPPDRPPVPARG